jgi:hypothetical protein
MDYSDEPDEAAAPSGSGPEDYAQPSQPTTPDAQEPKPPEPDIDLDV